MFIRSAHFENFTVFENAAMEFSPGINVLIGKNGTGKSHVLKALYGLAEGSRRVHLDISFLGGKSLRNLIDGAQITVPADVLTVMSFLSGIFSTELRPDVEQLLKRKRENTATNHMYMKLSILVDSATKPFCVKLPDKSDQPLFVTDIPQKSQLTGSTTYIPHRAADCSSTSDKGLT